MSYVAETASKVEFIGKAGEMGSKVGKWAGSQALRSPITTWKAGKGAIGAAGKGIKGGYKIIQNKEGMKAALDEHIAND
ncbi:MAG: hypothetical protein U9Q15_04165 [Patescibacteria group bacterium]|nr:hypothetical protein [Patescibacteria group bacterium]